MDADPWPDRRGPQFPRAVPGGLIHEHVLLSNSLPFRYNTKYHYDISASNSSEQATRKKGKSMCQSEIQPEPSVSPVLFPPVPVILPFGFIIRRIRELSGMTQNKLARLSEANLSYISTVESSVNNISIRKMLLICNALRMQPGLVMDIQQNVAGSAWLEKSSVNGP
jgi:hypothetical protein